MLGLFRLSKFSILEPISLVLFIIISGLELEKLILFILKLDFNFFGYFIEEEDELEELELLLLEDV